MSEILNLINKNILNNNFYIPEINTEIPGKELSFKQYQTILDLKMNEGSSLEDFIEVTDKIIKENFSDTTKLSYIDKIFLLNQLKFSQKDNLFEITLEQYKETLRSRCSELDLNQFSHHFKHKDLEIEFGVNSFDYCYELNKQIFDVGSSHNIPTLISAEVIRSIKKIIYQGEELELTYSTLSKIIPLMPANVFKAYSDFSTKLSSTLSNINTFNMDGEDVVVFPTIDNLLSL